MSVLKVTADRLIEVAKNKAIDTKVVLDIGCGIRPQFIVRPLVHICCEPYQQYIDVLIEKTRNESDRTYVITKATWTEAINIFPEESVDTIFLVDVIEHLTKDEALPLLNKTVKIARQQVIIFTPLGFMPQFHADGKDAWGLDGADWQEHKSGWLPEDFGDGWEFIVSDDFHKTDSSGRILEKPFGAFWAIKNIEVSNKNNMTKIQMAHAAVDKLFNTYRRCINKLKK